MTESPWGWHIYDTAAESIRNADSLRLTSFDSIIDKKIGKNGGEKTSVGYPTDETGQEKLFNDLRQNPHKAHLGKIAFNDADGGSINIKDAGNIRQELNLYDGVIYSEFMLHGKRVTTETFVSPNNNTVWINAESKLFTEKALCVSIEFPFGSHKKSGADFSPQNKNRHTTSIMCSAKDSVLLKRSMAVTGAGNSGYSVFITYGKDCKADFSVNEHKITISSESGILQASVTFLGNGNLPPPNSYDNAKTECENFWHNYWSAGSFLERSTAGVSAELERRIILSQYLEAIQCRGELPPAETALTCNSWYGKFHLEMHFWHTAHFILWGREAEAKKSLSYYVRTLSDAKSLAASQGYEGARFSKMCAPPHAGARAGEYLSPSSIAPLLVWQQPHPVVLLELCFMSAQKRGDTAECDALLSEYREVVRECARFMVSFLYDDSPDSDGRLILGPPVIPAQERFNPAEVKNPSFEVSYWKFGLTLAAKWMERVGDTAWANEFAETARKIALPATHDYGEGAVYTAAESCPETFTQKPFFSDHPSMLLSFGMLSGNGDIDTEAMRRTLDMVLKVWDMSSLWGWDFALLAMTAARLSGRKDEALRLLLLDNPKNTYLPNGHNLQGGVSDLPLYLPGNASFLLAVAMIFGIGDYF